MEDCYVENSCLVQSNEILDLFSSIQLFKSNRVIHNIENLGYPYNGELKNNEMSFYKIEQLSFDEDYPHREAFENVLLSLDNEAFNFVYILTGNKNGIELCIGVVKNRNENQVILDKKLSASNYGEIVASVFDGNFNGSKLKKLTGKELTDRVIASPKKYKNAGVIMGIPSLSEVNSENKYDFQGIDRLINSMLGLEWRIEIICEPVSKREILELREDIYELYNRLYVCSKMSLQNTNNNGQTISFGKNISDSKSKNWGSNLSDSDTKGKANSSGTENSSKTHQYGTSKGISRDHSEGKNYGYNMNRGSSESVTIEIANKHSQELMKYIDEELLERIKVGFSKGLFKTSIYYMAKEPTHANRLKVGIMSLFQGNKSTYSPLVANKIDLDKEENYCILNNYQNQFVYTNDYSSDTLMLLGRPYYKNLLELSTYLTTEEVSLIAGLPQKEVPGLSLKEGVNFGLNETNIKKEEAINLGVMVQKGRKLDDIPFLLNRSSMTKHTFVAGVTGSGKTTTCHRLLFESKIPFLVIEPSKTEYRTLINSKNYKDIVVFTLGNESVAPFRINPFELIKGEVISAHVDMLKATFTSAFPMEASMPQILEEAMYICYEKKGWNINTNENDIHGEKAFNSDVNSFPIMSELLEVMKDVVEKKGFSQQMKADYIGSLVSRLSNLTVGSKGNMLNCEHSIDFNYIIKNNVILEMEELKSPEDKALFMGFILSRLSAVIKIEHKKNNNFKHLTLIEEAHRLLSKVEYGDSGSKKTAVETFTDLLAEIRKYGEGLIIVDQIPNKLAPEVLKNTNTKIIHKILAKDDKEAVGDTMLMDEKQKEYLSALNVGNAIIFTENTDKPVHVNIKPISDTSEQQVEDNLVRGGFLKKKACFGSSYDDLEVIPYYMSFEQVINDIKNRNINKLNCNKLKDLVDNISNNYKISRNQVWKKFINRRAKLNGQKYPVLEKFFEETFYYEDFGEKYVTLEIFSNLI